MNDTEHTDRGRQPLPAAAALARMGLIGGLCLAAVVAFAYTGGWLTPKRLSQQRMIASFDAMDGVFPGFRKNHAKGVCATGWFDSNGAAARLSKAALFRPGRVPVVGRFALAGGLPFQPDAPAKVRSLALRFLPAGAAEWRTGMINIPVFPVNSAQGFYDLQIASAPEAATGKPNPGRMQALLAAHPETARAFGLIKARAVSSSFGNATYNGLDAFNFIDSSGNSVPVRWSVVPLQVFTPAQAATPSNTDYLFDGLIADLAHAPLQWHLMVTQGQPGDPTADATLPWPAADPQLDAGIITFDHAVSEENGSCTPVVYDPLVLPPGITGSDDPLLSARSGAYARSFTLRAAEAAQKKPSEITPKDIASGGKP